MSIVTTGDVMNLELSPSETWLLPAVVGAREGCAPRRTPRIFRDRQLENVTNPEPGPCSRRRQRDEWPNSCATCSLGQRLSQHEGRTDDRPPGDPHRCRARLCKLPDSAERVLQRQRLRR